MSDFKRNSLTSAVIYKYPKKALDWLEKAFGFELAMLVTHDDGKIGHAEMRHRECLIMIGDEWNESAASPASIGGRNTQTVHVQLDEGIDRHCERARSAGAVILMEPEDQFYGDRTYRARDPEGHVWTFGQTVREVSVGEMNRMPGVTVKVFP